MSKKKTKSLAVNNPGDEILKDKNPAEPVTTKGKTESDCEIKDVFAFIGALALASALVYGFYLGVTYLLSPSYSEGKCLSQSEYSNSITAKVISNDLGIYYQYADKRDNKIDTKRRQTADFKETYPVQIDCEIFFNNREYIELQNQRDSYLKYLEELREQLYKEKAKNANRPRKG